MSCKVVNLQNLFQIRSVLFHMSMQINLKYHCMQAYYNIVCPQHENTHALSACRLSVDAPVTRC